MAVTPRTLPDTGDDAFLREVDEGVRRDQMASLWQRYGRLTILAVVLVLGSLGGWLWWKEHQVKLAGVAGEDFTQALAKAEVGETSVSKPVFDRLAKDGPGGYSGLARMMQAADAVKAGDNAAAIKLLDAVAADTGQPQPVRDAALIKSVRLGFDTLAPATVVARLKSLAIPGDPWFAIAGEMTAMAQLKAGDVAAAKTMLTAVAREASAPPSLRGRVAELALSLGVDAALLNPPGTAGPASAAADAPAAPVATAAPATAPAK